MTTNRQRGLAFSTLRVLEKQLSALDGLEQFKTEEREEIERVLRVLIEDAPITELLDCELKILRDELPKADFGDRIPDVETARAALTVLKRALGLPVLKITKRDQGLNYGNDDEND